MFKSKIIIMFVLTLASACSKNNSTINMPPNSNDISQIEPIQLSSPDGFLFGGVYPQLEISNPSSNIANFGSVAQNSGISTFSYPIQNQTYGTVLKGGSVAVDVSGVLSPYSVKCYNGLTEQSAEINCATIRLKKGSSANVVISLDSTQQAGIIPDQVLKINNMPIAIKGMISVPEIVNSVTIGSTSLSFDAVDPREASTSQIINVQATSKLKYISITSPAIGSIGTQGFKVVSNSCLVPFRGSCQITVNFDNASAIFGSNITDTMKIDNTDISLSASLISPPISKIIPVAGVSDVINLGTIYLDEAMPALANLQFRLASLSSSYSESVLSVISDSLGLSVSQNCTIMTKSIGCQVSASLVKENLTSGAFSASIKLQSNLGNSREAIIKANFQLSRNTIACTLDNSGKLNASSVSGTLTSGCQAETCIENYNPIAGNCEAISCNLLNANKPFASSVSGTLVSGCQAETCQYGFDAINGNCQEIACTLTNANILHAVTVTGTIPMGCQVLTCESGYDKSQDNLSCISNIPLSLISINFSQPSSTDGPNINTDKVKYISLITNELAPVVTNNLAVHNQTPLSTNTSNIATNEKDIKWFTAAYKTFDPSPLKAIDASNPNSLINLNGVSSIPLSSCGVIPLKACNVDPIDPINFNITKFTRSSLVDAQSLLLNGVSFPILPDLMSHGKIRQIYSNSSYSDSPSSLIALNGILYFAANNINGASKLFKYDPINNQVSQISNTTNDQEIQDAPSELTIYNDSIYFRALSPLVSGSFPSRLYKYDPLTNIVSKISRTAISETNDDDPRNLIVYNNELYFAATNLAGSYKLHAYNGSSVRQISNIGVYGVNDNVYSQNVGAKQNAIFQGKLYFIGGIGSGVTKLFSYSAQNNVIKQVSDLAPESEPGAGDEGRDLVEELTVNNGKLFFKAGQVGFPSRKRLYSYDGVNDFKLLTNTIAAGVGENPSTLYSHLGKLYFRMFKNDGGYRLVEYDDVSGIITQKALLTASGYSDWTFATNVPVAEQRMASMNGKLYFSSITGKATGSKQSKLFEFDPQSQKIIQISNINNLNNDDPKNLIEMNGKLYFSARIGTAVRLFEYDGN